MTHCSGGPTRCCSRSPRQSIDAILQAYPHIGRRPRSTRSQAEQCSVFDPDPAVMAELDRGGPALHRYVRFRLRDVRQRVNAREVTAAIDSRLHNDAETERKVVRNELARINRTRLERMLGPEGGYQNW